MLLNFLKRKHVRMADRVNFIINGKEVRAFEGEYLLDVARRLGIEIPSLCHFPGIEPYASCRLCIVKVKAGGRERIVTSCNYPVKNGIQVITNDEKILKLRKMIVKLLLFLAPDSQELVEISKSLGIRKEELNLENVREGGKCILCGLCVRVCSEVVGAHAITFSKRGKEREISTPYNEMDVNACIGCGACSFVCPTGCIEMETLKLRELMLSSSKGGMPCRYSLMGLLPGAICDNNYDCPGCFVDRQMIEIAQGKHPAFLIREQNE